MDPTLLDRLLRAGHLLREDTARAFAGSALTEARAGVLWVLHAQGPSTQQAVAQALRVSARNVSGLVDALEDLGYVRRDVHPQDRRAVLVALTSTAEQVMEAMAHEHADLDRRLRESVAPEDREAFARGLEAVVTTLERLVAEAAS